MKRLTFPHIATERHPLAVGNRVALSVKKGLYHPTKEDIDIARDILEVHTRLTSAYGATGEWKWINRNRRSKYLSLLEKGDPKKLAYCLANMFRNDAIYGIISSDFAKARTKKGQFDLENQILLDLDTLVEFDEHEHRSLAWSVQDWHCGNPYGYLTRKNTLIVVDTARHIYYANKINALLNNATTHRPTIFEVGGGYGGLCLELLNLSDLKGLRYINCDLPETLYLCYFFLKKMLPSSVRIGWATEKMPNADIILVPAHKKDLVTHADIMFNTLSLSEMGRKTVDEYIGILHKIKPRYFLHTNSNFVLFPDSERHVEVTASEFGIKDSVYKRIYMALSPWQGGGGRSREYLYIRRDK